MHRLIPCLNKYHFGTTTNHHISKKYFPAIVSVDCCWVIVRVNAIKVLFGSDQEPLCSKNTHLINPIKSTYNYYSSPLIFFFECANIKQIIKMKGSLKDLEEERIEPKNC